MMRNIDQYNNNSASDYFDVVLLSDEISVEAVYYLLQKRLHRALKRVFELHGFGLSDDFDDTIDDFYLYLYDGNCEGGRPFSILKSIQNKQAFFGWTVATYRNFLLNKAKEEVKRKALLEQNRVWDDGKGINEETMIDYLASAIACADQQFLPRNRFILYRMLLSLLDHSRAIPQEAMAYALNMRPVTYRVCNKRQKERLLDYILLQESGQSLELNAFHLIMRERIVAGFNQLYSVLIEYYELTLKQLPTAPAIQSLRRQSARDKGFLMHEESQYGFGSFTEVKQLYEALKRYSTS